MRSSLVHELPGRLRIELSVPRSPAPDPSFVESSLSVLPGVEHVSFNPRSGRLTIRHNGAIGVRDALLKELRELPLPLPATREREPDGVARKKRAVLVSGALLAARPLFPAPLQPLLAFYGSLSILWKGASAAVNRRLNAEVLDATAVGVAMGVGDHGTAGTISFLLKLGGYLEEWTKQKSSRNLAEMFRLEEGWAWIRRDGREAQVEVKDIAAGDLVVVRAGGRIPVDGIIVEGEAMVNQSSITGEPFPVAKRPGIAVYAGTALSEGRLVVRATCVGSETKVSKIVKIIQESESFKADVQSHAERLADRMVPYSFLLSGLAYALTGNALRAASALLVDYSCAIKLSVPLAIRTAMMDASRRGVLIKGGRFIEKMARADVFVLDKTGTLTEARPDVVDVIPLNGYRRDFLLTCAACVEEHFPHPVATAVVRKAEMEGLLHGEEAHATLEYVVAHGIASMIGDKRILVGSRHFIHEDNGICLNPAEGVIGGLTEKGHSILYVAIGDELAGVIAVEDPLRADALPFLRSLKQAGVHRVIMLTGDGDAAAKRAAEDLGISEYHAQAFPDRKAEVIRELKGRGHVVAMVGDGINDSPALSLADVGISMRHGADIAREACDVMLLGERLERIVEAMEISRNAMSTIRRNFAYIMGINSSLIVLGLAGALSCSISGLLHNAATVAVALNSLRPYHGGEGYCHGCDSSGKCR
jgi:heavy metal translocating P-type ATPase